MSLDIRYASADHSAGKHLRYIVDICLHMTIQHVTFHYFCHHSSSIIYVVSDIVMIFVLKGNVKLQLTNYL